MLPVPTTTSAGEEEAQEEEVQAVQGSVEFRLSGKDHRIPGADRDGDVDERAASAAHPIP